ncbi:hypothetical protein [uncultured Acinetobacter sp.]|mgnify:FL=1|uniref:hypothetical protein n=1 Tax=uncultured Acinetobacter sp. TaxID=165433 RepID=UPI0026345BB8|nr:hypothetical protein [uncultured Acinetobacter sp.]
MRNSKILALCMSVFLVGCTTKVITYDQYGNRVGSCQAQAWVPFAFGLAGCHQYKQQLQMPFAKINAQGQLELLPLPQKTQVKLNHD